MVNTLSTKWWVIVIEYLSNSISFAIKKLILFKNFLNFILTETRDTRMQRVTLVLHYMFFNYHLHHFSFHWQTTCTHTYFYAPNMFYICTPAYPATPIQSMTDTTQNKYLVNNGNIIQRKQYNLHIWNISERSPILYGRVIYKCNIECACTA